MTYRRATAVAVFLFAVFVAAPWTLAAAGRGDLISALTSVALLSVISSGVWLTFYIGRINIGQGAFALLGGYVSAILVVKYDVLFWWTLPAAGLFCAAASVCIGLPILRLRGVYFAMVTLTLTEVARLTAQALPITNGPAGITNIPPPGALSLFGLELIPNFAELENLRLGFYYLAASLLVLCFAGMWRLVNSRLGFLCRSLQQNEELAASIGVNVARLRLLAYAISSFLGGVGGAVFAAIVQSVYPATFPIQESVNYMLYCFMGGLGYVFGPMLGTLTLYMGWDFLFRAGEYQLLIYATALILLMLFLPNGLMSIRPGLFRTPSAGRR
ncbi:MAG: branched-chain amino acid ABC transporter permease [Gammaproteobacteria bacterium]